MTEHSNYAEINPIEKLNEILDELKSYSTSVLTSEDESYGWLGEDSKCIVVSDPSGVSSMEIVLSDGGEFTLYFADAHAHYLAYQYDFERMLQDIKDILDNGLCSGNLTDSEGKWYGSGIFKMDKISENTESVFQHVFETKEFSDHLMKMGYTAEYKFWDPANNKIIKKQN